MGADLISFIIKGPLHLDPEKKAEAIARAQGIRALADRLVEMWGAGVADSDVVAHAEEHGGYFVLTHGDGRKEIDEDMHLEVDLIRPKDIPQLVEDLFNIWDNGARDASTRVFPDDPEHMVLVTGDMSWGDEPDGWAYQTIKKCRLLDILDAFGIV